MNILLPTDFSINSKNAVEYAMSFFSGENCKFFLVNIFDEPKSALGIYKPISENIWEQAKKDLDAFYQALSNKKLEPNFTFDLLLKKGSITREVNTIISHEKIDAVFMGTQGVSGIKEKLIGSVTAKIIHNVDCVIVAVPRNVKFIQPERIAFATDLEPLKNYDIVDPLLETVKHFDSQLMIVHTYNPKKPIKELAEIVESNHLKKKMSEIDEAYFYLQSDDTEAEIEKFVQKHDIQMLAMITREQGILSRLFKKSTVVQMSFHTDIPLIAIPNN